MRRQYLIIFFLCLFSTGAGQSILWAGKHIDDFHIRHFSTENGLPQSSVKAIAVGKIGFVWLATEAGLVRYDGQRFMVFNKTNSNMINTRIITFQRAADSTLQALMEESTYLQIISGRPTALSLDEQKLFPSLRGTPADYQLLPYMWVRSNTADAFGFRKIKLSLDTQNAICISLPDLRIDWYKSGKPVNRYTVPAIKRPHSLFLIRQNVYIPITDRRQLKAIRFTAERLDTVQVKGDVLKDPDCLNNIVISNEAMEQVFMRTEKGLYLVNALPDGTLNTVLLLYGFDFKDSQITAVYYDARYNRIFLGSAYDGLFILSPRLFKTLINEQTASALTGNVYYHHIPLNDYGVVTGKGVAFSIKPETSYRIPLLESINDGTNFGSMVFRDHEERVWFAGARLIGYTDPAIRHIERKWYIDGRATAFLPLSPDRYWVGMSNGRIYTVNPRSAAEPQLLMDAVSYIFCMLKQGDEVWIGTRKDLFRYDLKARRLEAVPELKGKVVRNLYAEPNGDIWICTYEGGLFLYRNGDYISFPKDRQKGLNAVHAIVSDHNGFFWLSTNAGLYQIRKQDLIDYADRKIRTVFFLKYDKSSGFNTNEFNGGGTMVATQLASGYATFASMNGIVFFKPDSIKAEEPDAEIIFDYITVDNEIITIGDTVNIARDFFNMSVYLASPYMGNPINLHIEYRLDNASWLPVDNMQISFNQLTAGNHTLELRKRSGFERKYNYSKPLVLFVPPAYYETLQFRLGILLGVCLLIGLVFFLRTLYHKKKTKMLEQAVTERTADLEKSIGALQQSELNMAQQLQFQQQLSNNIAHDIRTPLKYLMIASRYLSDKVLRAEMPDKEDASGLFLSAERIYNYTDSLTKYLKAKSLIGDAPQPVHVHSLIEQKKETFELAAKERRIQILNNVCPNYDLQTYPELFDILIHNLMDNAVKNTVKGYIEVKNEMGDQYPILVIEDCGIGMSAEQIEHYNSFLNADHSAAVSSYVGFGFLFMKDAQNLLDLKIALEPAPYGGLRVLLHLYKCIP